MTEDITFNVVLSTGISMACYDYMAMVYDAQSLYHVAMSIVFDQLKMTMSGTILQLGRALTDCWVLR